MRYSPYAYENDAIGTMTDSQLLEFFLTRVFETEEVWGLDDSVEWTMRESKEDSCLPVWPYQSLAKEAAIGHWQSLFPSDISLEEFMNETLVAMAEDNIQIEIIPRANRKGCLISAQQLYSILLGMQDAGEYRFDG